MTFACSTAGFTAVDVTVIDPMAGHGLSSFKGIASRGRFSHDDVLARDFCVLRMADRPAGRD